MKTKEPWVASQKVRKYRELLRRVVVTQGTVLSNLVAAETSYCSTAILYLLSIGLLQKSWSLSSTFFPRLPRATTEVFLFYFYTISKSVFAAMWARWSDMLFSRKKFTRKHGRHGQTLKIYFSRTNWFFLTKTWGIIRELLLYPKHIFTDFWNNGKWKKQNVAQIQLPVTCGTCNTLHFELIRAVITVVVNNVPPAFNKVKNTGVIEWRRHCRLAQKECLDRKRHSGYERHLHMCGPAGTHTTNNGGHGCDRKSC